MISTEVDLITAKEAQALVGFKAIFEKSTEDQLKLLSSLVTQEISSAALRGDYTVRSSILLAKKMESISILCDILRRNGFTLKEEGPCMAISWHPSKLADTHQPKDRTTLHFLAGTLAQIEDDKLAADFVHKASLSPRLTESERQGLTDMHHRLLSGETLSDVLKRDEEVTAFLRRQIADRRPPSLRPGDKKRSSR